MEKYVGLCRNQRLMLPDSTHTQAFPHAPVELDDAARTQNIQDAVYAARAW